MAVANAPGRAYNPLFVYGETGLGKTHLMHAVAHQMLANNPKARIAYVSTEKFTNEFIHAIRENKLTKFQQNPLGGYGYIFVLLFTMEINQNIAQVNVIMLFLMVRFITIKN